MLSVLMLSPLIRKIMKTAPYFTVYSVRNGPETLNVLMSVGFKLDYNLLLSPNGGKLRRG